MTSLIRNHPQTIPRTAQPVEKSLSSMKTDPKAKGWDHCATKFLRHLCTRIDRGGEGDKSDKWRLRAKNRHNLPKGMSMSMAWLEPRGTQAEVWLRHFQGRSLTRHAAGRGGVGGGQHLCVQENNPLLGNKEVDATGLAAPPRSFISALWARETYHGGAGGVIRGQVLASAAFQSEASQFDSHPPAKFSICGLCCLGAALYIM